MSQNETEIKLIDPFELHPNPINVTVYGEEEVDQELVESIRLRGQLDPLVITDGNVIISGHRRWLVLKTLGKTAACILKHFDDELDMKEAIIECNRQRKKTFSQTCNEIELLESIYAERAEQRRLANLVQNTDVLKSEHREESGRTIDLLTKSTGVKRDTLSKMMKVHKEAKSGNEIAIRAIQKADANEISINATYTIIKLDEIATSGAPEAERAKKLVDDIDRGIITSTQALKQIKQHQETIETQKVKAAKVPYGVYNVIVSDTYPVEDIMHKQIHIDDDSVLFIWSNATTLLDSLELMEHWKFKYESMVILDKDIKGTGSLVLSSSFDILLVGTYGAGVYSVHKLPGVIHGKKHDCIYELIEKMYPYGRYLEFLKDPKRHGWNEDMIDTSSKQLISLQLIKDS